jgi:protein-S-isoprenylcysteine O-methyltransferase Ste14
MSLSFAKSRILLSRLAAVAIFVLYLFSGSHWELHLPLVASLLFLAGMILVGIGSLGRMWCSLYIAGYKDSTLITQGPYSMTRNPLYFFSFLGLLGIGLVTETFTFPLIFLLFFALGYPRVISAEEKKLRQLFGSAYEEYAQQVPAFFPRISLLDEPEHYTVNPRVYRKHMLSAVWFIWIVGIFELMNGLKAIGILPTFWILY